MVGAAPQIFYLYVNIIQPGTDCSISLKFGTVWSCDTTDTLQVFKAKWSEVKVTWLMPTIRRKEVNVLNYGAFKAENDWRDVGMPSSCNES